MHPCVLCFIKKKLIFQKLLLYICSILIQKKYFSQKKDRIIIPQIISVLIKKKSREITKHRNLLKKINDERGRADITI